MDWLIELIPSAGAVGAVFLLLFAVNRYLHRSDAVVTGKKFRNQMIMLVLTAFSLFVVLLVLPIGDTMRGQLLSLIGILLSAAIALSSTTVLGNAMAGVMVRAVRGFRIGDFVRVGDHFGRVSERGLFHTEIQTEDRELTTLPNLFLVTNPVTTIRSSGTIVSATVSLGYDVSHRRVDELLLAAAAGAKLEKPFVQVLELGDFSVTYRVAGLLREVKQLLWTRSRLRECVLDRLHEGGVEIVSPNFMNQRVLDPARQFIPHEPAPQADADEVGPEQILFDKADLAESLEVLRANVRKLTDEIAAHKAEMKKIEDETERQTAGRKLEALDRRLQRMTTLIETRESEQGDKH